MNGPPHTNEPDDTSDSGDETDAKRTEHPESAPVDPAERGYLEDRDPSEYPDTLRITADPEGKYRRDALDRMDRWQKGEEVPRVINFEDPSDLRALLTDRRVELLRSVMREQPSSIRDLATRVDRDVKSVHDDLQVLAEYDVVHFERSGRAKRPFVPYETIEVRLQITESSSTEEGVRA